MNYYGPAVPGTLNRIVINQWVNGRHAPSWFPGIVVGYMFWLCWWSKKGEILLSRLSTFFVDREGRLRDCTKALHFEDDALILNDTYPYLPKEAYIAIGKALACDDRIAMLALGGNELGVDEVRAIAEALPHNTTLTHLSLEVNDFGDEGAIVLAEGFKKNSSLLALQLGGCRISDRGAAALAEALKQNPNIGSLDLRGNNISSGLMAKISELLLTRDQRLEEQQKTAGKAELEEQRHRIRDLQQQIERIKQNERSGFLSRRELFLIVIVAVLVGFLFNPFAK
ncbi:Lrr-gala family type III effector protein (Gala 1) [Balamuthia mandrillaris]